jgi:hypothetical protein
VVRGGSFRRKPDAFLRTRTRGLPCTRESSACTSTGTDTRTTRRKRGGAVGRACALLGLLALALTCACGQEERPITQLILVADTDIPDIDGIQFELAEPGGSATALAQAPHAPGGGPSYVSVVHGERSLGPLTVSARAMRRGVEQLARSQQVSFVRDQTRVVLLHLFASCMRPPRCPAEQSCDGSGCIPRLLSEAALQTWEGAPPSITGSAQDAGSASDADAGQCGEPAAVDLQTDHEHCGSCSTACNDKQTCVAGKCMKT